MTKLISKIVLRKNYDLTKMNPGRRGGNLLNTSFQILFQSFEEQVSYPFYFSNCSKIHTVSSKLYFKHFDFPRI